MTAYATVEENRDARDGARKDRDACAIVEGLRDACATVEERPFKGRDQGVKDLGL